MTKAFKSAERWAPDAVQQYFSGSDVRVGGRDYVERQYVVEGQNALMFCPEAELDEHALNNEYVFASRFGFAATQPARAKLIAMKKGKYLTDADIRQMHKLGAIGTEDGSLVIRSHPYAKLAGQIAIFFLGLIVIICLFALVFQFFSSASVSPAIVAMALLYAAPILMVKRWIIDVRKNVEVLQLKAPGFNGQT